MIDKVDYTPTKVTYIKIRKGDRVYYLGENGGFTDEAHARCFFNSQQANEIVAKMRADPRFQNYDARPFETSYIPHQEIETKQDESHTVSTDIAPRKPIQPIIEKPVIEHHAEHPSVSEQQLSVSEQRHSFESPSWRETEPRLRFDKIQPDNKEHNRDKRGIIIAILAIIACIAVVLAIALT